MKKPRLSPLVFEMVAGMASFCDTVESGEPITKRYTVKTVTLNLQSRPYGAEDIKVVRKKLNASQALLANFLGVSVNSIRAWEQGTRVVPKIACRFLDEIIENPDVWSHRLRMAGESVSS
jgi:DNA-binding transcriptional regulator YiaG